MNVNKSRGLIISLSILSVVFSFAIKDKWIALLTMAFCIVIAIIILYKNLEELTDICSDSPKMKTLRTVTIFNIFVLAACVIFAILTGTNILKLDTDGRYFAASIVAVVMLFTGNIAPKLPFSKHTGLRLPWTVIDAKTEKVIAKTIENIRNKIVIIVSNSNAFDSIVDTTYEVKKMTL